MNLSKRGSLGGFAKAEKLHQPRAASQIVRDLFAEMAQRRIPLATMAQLIRYDSNQLSAWKLGKAEPKIMAMEAIAHHLGYQLTLMPIVKEPENDAEAL